MITLTVDNNQIDYLSYIHKHYAYSTENFDELYRLYCLDMLDELDRLYKLKAVKKKLIINRVNQLLFTEIVSCYYLGLQADQTQIGNRWYLNELLQICNNAQK